MRCTLFIALLGLAMGWLQPGAAGAERTARKTLVLDGHHVSRIDSPLATPRPGLQETRPVVKETEVDGSTEKCCHDSKCFQSAEVGDDQVESEGILLDYDFLRGSLPDKNGRIKDLSPSGIHGLIRPTTIRAPPLERTGWLEHRVLQGDGRGGWVSRPAKIQAIQHPNATMTMPFGLVRMDNGELALQCSAEGKPTRPVIAFSRDDGETWTDFIEIPGASGRPMLLTCHGGGMLSFVAGRRYFSHDYGRTWADSVVHPPTRAGRSFHLEGSAWVDRDQNGKAKAILELGWHYAPGKTHPRDDATVVFRRSIDGGRSWIDEFSPPQWKFTMRHAGKSWLRGVSEGAIVRAANGDLVAALRSDMPPSFFSGPHDDGLEGTAISISQDDGQTWSKMNILFYAGRHHANLQRLPNNDLVCTMIVRDDVDGLNRASDRRGCDALVSRDNGQTWNVDRRYELDAWRYDREDGYWVDGKCGHIAAVALPDGHVISAYGHYLKGAAVLVKWHPDARPAMPVKRDLDRLERFVSSAILNQVARRNVDYRVQPSALVLTGRAWIQIPLEARLAALDKNGTIELVFKPHQQGGMPMLIACAAPGVDGFRISYDQRNVASSSQVLFSDQRVQSDRMEYSIQVNSQSDPRPFTTDFQQIAYVMRGGHGTFYRDGRRFSKQTETGDAGSLFHYTVKQAGTQSKLFISIGALVRDAVASNPIQGELHAIRIYNRPLSVAELQRNRAATD
ncbi:MAG: LamG-like jellyroll fold domain-containing protein [Planctomycetota bacterium]|nr:LamG-like jellyroll fold domain-containing protein [Planctomycetota bacterium]